jgi:hypothetical protein
MCFATIRTFRQHCDASQRPRPRAAVTLEKIYSRINQHRNGWGSGPCLRQSHPAAISGSARSTRLDGLPVKVGPLFANKRWVYALEGVDVDDRIQAIGDLAGHEGYHSASGANVERRRLCPERVLRHRGAIANSRVQHQRIGAPRFQLRGERKRTVPLVRPTSVPWIGPCIKVSTHPPMPTA